MPLRKTAVLNVVGLTTDLLDDRMPRLKAWANRGRMTPIATMLPAVTCSVQATYLTGKYPSEHGIVANGWYFKDECEVKFWRQSNKLIQAPKIWDAAREFDGSFSFANLFWWYNMYSSAEYSVTPRPIYAADGLKLPDIYTTPAPLREELQAALGPFPLFDFWGPRAGIKSTEWIAQAARHVHTKFGPTLNLVYLPHLDYNLQRLGPADPAIGKDLAAVDRVCGDLIDFYERDGTQVVVLSEYGITSVSRPIHLNRVLREAGLIAIRTEQGLELLDVGASAAFAVADHQVAHVYVNDGSQRARVFDLLQRVEGVDLVLDDAGKPAFHIDHARSGDFVVVAKPDSWFTYYYWIDDKVAPDFARTVDIHRKPGYDPVELFLDPAIRIPALKVGGTLIKKKLGFRYLMDVTPLDATLVKGSHGAIAPLGQGPLFITQQAEMMGGHALAAADVYGLILRHLAGA